MSSLRSWFEWVDALPSSVAIRESIYGYPVLLTSHVISMCLFAGLIIVMDLRLLGVGQTRTPFTEVQRRLFPWQMAGLTVNAITGSILFYGQPMRYYANVFFWTKVSMMVLALINALAFHWMTYQSVDTWDVNRALIPRAAKLAGIVSIVLWAGVIITGRMTAYNWFQ